jgi:hypothetical protein
MLAFETRIELRNKNNRSRSSANAVSWGHGVVDLDDQATV